MALPATAVGAVLSCSRFGADCENTILHLLARCVGVWRVHSDDVEAPCLAQARAGWQYRRSRSDSRVLGMLLVRWGLGSGWADKAVCDSLRCQTGQEQLRHKQHSCKVRCPPCFLPRALLVQSHLTPYPFGTPRRTTSLTTHECNPKSPSLSKTVAGHAAGGWATTTPPHPPPTARSFAGACGCCT